MRVWSSTSAINLDRGNIYLCVGLSAAVSSLPSVDAPSALAFGINGESLNMRVLFLLGTGRGSREIFYLC